MKLSVGDLLLAGTLAVFLHAASEAGETSKPAKPPTQAVEPICGEPMMSAKERDDHRRRMREARDAAERNRLEDEHRGAMMDRAKKRGAEWREGPGCRRAER